MTQSQSLKILAISVSFALLGAYGCDEIAEVTPAPDSRDTFDTHSEDVGNDTGDVVPDAAPDSDVVEIDGDIDDDVFDGGDGRTDNLSHCLLIDTTDWLNSGALAVLDLDTGEIRENLTTYHSDATIQVVDGDVYMMNRLFGDSLMKLDPDDSYAVEWEFSLGNATNPSQLARHGDFGFVSLYDNGKVVEVNLADPTSESFLTGREIVIPTGESDGEKAEPGDLFVYDGVLYVVNEGLNDALECTQSGRSRLHAYDAETLAPVKAFENGTEDVLTLRACNASVERRDSAELIVRSMGNYQFTTSGVVNDGVVESVNLNSGTRGELLFTEQGAGGRDIFIVESDDDQAWAVLAGDDFFGIDLVELDLSNARWSVKRELYNGYLWALAAYDGLLYASERDLERTGILVFDSATGEQLVEQTIHTQTAPDDLVRYDREDGCW